MAGLPCAKEVIDQILSGLIAAIMCMLGSLGLWATRKVFPSDEDVEALRAAADNLVDTLAKITERMNRDAGLG